MRVLVVEDDPLLGKTLARGLRCQAYAVDLVTDGGEGVYHAAISDYDAVGLDYMLARRLRRATSCLERVALGGATTAM
jgi:two-component system, OmpR family, response regulator